MRREVLKQELGFGLSRSGAGTQRMNAKRAHESGQSRSTEGVGFEVRGHAPQMSR
jgi:hypothetical protein